MMTEHQLPLQSDIFCSLPLPERRMIPARYSPVTYALFRIVFGGLWIFHGLQKYGVLDVPPLEVASLRGVAGIIEIGVGTLIMLGLFTRPAAFLACGQMAVAYFIAHFPRGAWPILNGGEPAVLYCFAFLHIASVGAGIWSLDALRASGRAAAASVMPASARW